jgi:RyR domain
MKTYSKPSTDLEGHIERMKAEHHSDLEEVTVGALFVFDDESSDQVLKHQGYPAGAVVSITPVKQRALGVADALIGVDLHLGNPELGPEASHESWMAHKLEAGWSYGAVKDAEAKVHPCMVPFDQLPKDQQAKDFVFRAVVHAMRASLADAR